MSKKYYFFFFIFLTWFLFLFYVYFVLVFLFHRPLTNKIKKIYEYSILAYVFLLFTSSFYVISLLKFCFVIFVIFTLIHTSNLLISEKICFVVGTKKVSGFCFECFSTLLFCNIYLSCHFVLFITMWFSSFLLIFHVH